MTTETYAESKSGLGIDEMIAALEDIREDYPDEGVTVKPAQGDGTMVVLERNRYSTSVKITSKYPVL